MKKIFSTFLIFSILFSSIFFANASAICNYSSQIEECQIANVNWNARSIEDFLCVSWLDEEKMVYNLILDDKFKPIDNKADKYLDDLQKNKNLYFWEDKKQNFLLWINDIYKKFWVWRDFEKAYKEALGDVITETLKCLYLEETSINKVKNYFPDNDLVNSLIKVKNSRRLKLAIDILVLNKQQVRKDASKKFMQVRRTKYDSVSNLFMVNLWYLMRLMFKWTSKTKNPY